MGSGEELTFRAGDMQIAPPDVGPTYCAQIEGKLCVKDVDSEKNDVCHGDSGGPLVWTQDDGSLVQIAVASAAYCDPSSGAAAYISIPSHSEWICEVSGICDEEDSGEEEDSDEDDDDDDTTDSTEEDSGEEGRRLRGSGRRS